MDYSRISWGLLRKESVMIVVLFVLIFFLVKGNRRQGLG